MGVFSRITFPMILIIMLSSSLLSRAQVLEGNLISVKALKLDFRDDVMRMGELLQEPLAGAEITDMTLDPVDWGISISDEMSFAPWIGLEVAAKYLGNHQASVTSSHGQVFKVQTRMTAVQVSPTVKIMLFGDRLGLMAKVGGSLWRERLRVWTDEEVVDDETEETSMVETRVVSTREDGVDLVQELSARLHLMNSIYLTAGYEKTEINDLDVETTSIGFSLSY